jgi:propanol-preferring alcohol dehydrogenase
MPQSTLRTMRAMALTAAGRGQLSPVEVPMPQAGPRDVVVKVRSCGVCRTDLHVVDGELPHTKTPVVPGHEIVGVIEELGANVSDFSRGDRVGIPWLAWACGECGFCRSDRENLCPDARFTGYTVDGGYAEYVRADPDFCVSLPTRYDHAHAAPLLCAGLIGYRAYRMAGAGDRIGIYGFGAAAHIITQVARHQGRQVYAFVKPGDTDGARFALDIGARWTGDSNQPPPAPLDTAIIFAPVGALVPEALARVKPGGTVVCAGIHMSDIPAFPYKLLWEERTVRSVANLTRADAREFLALASRIPLQTHVQRYPLAEANRALSDLRNGRVTGAAVLVP